MKQIKFSVIFMFSVITAQAQFHYDIKSTPDSAIVYVNNIEKCVTPCTVKYRWFSAIDNKVTITVKSDGYKTWSDTIRKKPRDFYENQSLNLELAFPIFDLADSKILISFDKLIADFKDGKIIGQTVDLNNVTEKIKWSGSIKVGDEIFESKFYEILTDMGYKSSYTEKAKLFSEEQKERPQLPRYSIGVQVTNYFIDLKQNKGKGYYSSNVTGRANVEFSWSVLDKANGKIVLKKVNNGLHRFTQNSYEEVKFNLVSFEKALIDFLGSKDFNDLIVNSESSDYIPEIKTNEDGDKINKIEKVVAERYNSNSEMIQKASEACVTIITDGGHGSGVVVSKEGQVLTAYHVIEGVNQIDVKFSNGLILKAKLIDFDKFNDIALLDITGEGFKALPLAVKGNNVGLGEELLTIGTPADIDLGQSISKGILSGKRKIEDRVYLQTDISVSPGNSGGPLLNMKGEVVGIVQKKIVGEGIEGIGFSLPMDEIRTIMGIVEQ